MRFVALLTSGWAGAACDSLLGADFDHPIANGNVSDADTPTKDDGGGGDFPDVSSDDAGDRSADGNTACSSGACEVTCDAGMDRSDDSCVGPGPHDIWQTVAPIPTGRFLAAATTALDGRIFVFGGYNGNAGGMLKTVEVYDPGTNEWKTAASMPTARYRFAAATALDGRIFVFGGISNGGGLSTVRVYNPKNDQWKSAADMPTARHSLVAATAHDGRIFVVSGVKDGSAPPLTTVEAYTP